MPRAVSMLLNKEREEAGGAFVCQSSQCGGGNVEIAKLGCGSGAGTQMLIRVLSGWAKIYRLIRIMKIYNMLGRGILKFRMPFANFTP